MAVLDKGMKQRMVGALVLVALAVIFLPMLFTREDEMRQVRVEAPQAPAMPSLPEVKVEPVAVPEPQPLPQEAQQAPVVVNESSAPVATPSQPITPSPQTQAQIQPKPQASAPASASKAQVQPATTPAPAATATAPSKIDVNGLPVSWSIQLASLSNRAGAESLQKTLRSQGYNAYIRSAGGMNRVYVGPLIERAEAERLRDAINRQQKLKGFVIRFQPERG
ncbi:MULTISPECIES: SPOR domain-containing protein [Pseudomonas]|jgi:DedD protein|uniref:Sporulation domain protein n=1 Tax=Pseudomonas putida (strain W619) TaxID=390235 RepID=B1J541_PSEPW|nr:MULTISPECIES: SPOR domain-containing protein [Pseudomonas]MDH1573226.1 SPOR domain-containing protein [Pseudomonas sp. GD03746]QQE85590.1 SPOR domain-containing protein [Pseudomonas putida]UTL82605.1 SPOR domain-containing protein [Pseudomonas putida]HEN8711272.1 SPOR domain-containing protein [Pseudomonas putida]HEN8717337.1 SPOR domain-containing protein [Pseudomonas putida]